ncbi:MAG TPA: GNAT family N-acetyltransferase [Bacteroidales bacterium]|nr:GNAT family N-acetyltransferase [Bacteroidales bacterium]HRW97371.1 GNAT family N-acetyltransferase [Bacteroidales bacterium]
MNDIIPKVDRRLLLDELTDEKFVRNTNFGRNKIFIINNSNSPHLMQEIGRLREISFRAAGGGTGKSVDIDAYDQGDNSFEQLIVWDPDNQEIIGGYRFIHGKNLEVDPQGKVKTPTSKLFHLSEKFINEYLPITIELGRSFVQPEYQPSKNVRTGIYSLDHLWDGLGMLIVKNPDVHYFFGKITMYPNSDLLAREAIMYFLMTFFPDPEKLVYPYNPLEIKSDINFFKELFNKKNYSENYKTLQQFVRKRNESIPPLVNAYMNLSSTMKTFGTSLNESFGKVEETGIMIKIPDIFQEKRERYFSGK